MRRIIFLLAFLLLAVVPSSTYAAGGPLRAAQNTFFSDTQGFFDTAAVLSDQGKASAKTLLHAFLPKSLFASFSGIKTTRAATKPDLSDGVCGIMNKELGQQCGGGTQPVYELGICKAEDVKFAYDVRCNYGNPPVFFQDQFQGCTAILACPNTTLCPCLPLPTEFGVIKRCTCLPITCEQICAGQAWLWDSVGKGCACAGGGGGAPGPPGPTPPGPTPPGPTPPGPIVPPGPIPPPGGGGQCTPATQGFCAPDQLTQCTAGTAWQGQENNASIVCKGESGGNPYAVNDSCLCGITKSGCTPTGDYSLGLFQYNLYAHCAGAFENLGSQCRMVNRTVLEQCIRDLGYTNFTLSADGTVDLTGASLNMCQYIQKAVGIYTGAGNSWCPWTVARDCGIAQSC